MFLAFVGVLVMGALCGLLPAVLALQFRRRRAGVGVFVAILGVGVLRLFLSASPPASLSGGMFQALVLALPAAVVSALVILLAGPAGEGSVADLIAQRKRQDSLFNLLGIVCTLVG